MFLTIITIVTSIATAVISGLAALIGSVYGVNKSSKTKKEVSQKQVKAQFKLAAMDTKLAKRQKAYSLCSKIFFNIHSNKIFDVVEEADKWWFKNCLYLEPESREAFKLAINNAALLNTNEKDELSKKIFNQIVNARNLIMNSVDRTPSELDHKIYKKEN